MWKDRCGFHAGKALQERWPNAASSEALGQQLDVSLERKDSKESWWLPKFPPKTVGNSLSFLSGCQEISTAGATKKTHQSFNQTSSSISPWPGTEGSVCMFGYPFSFLFTRLSNTLCTTMLLYHKLQRGLLPLCLSWRVKHWGEEKWLRLRS